MNSNKYVDEFDKDGRLKLGTNYIKYFIANEQIIQDIARVSGDKNPIHLDDEYAKKTVFGKRIAHALFCINGISMVIGNYLPGKGTILISQKFQYIQPVYIDDVIKITVIVVDVLAENKYLLETTCENQENNIILKGESLVKWEKKLA